MMSRLVYMHSHSSDIGEEELTRFICNMDESFIRPIRSRYYFTSYQSLATKFIQRGRIVHCRNHSEELVGVAVFYADPEQYDFAYETYIVVHPGFRGLGISKKLMQMEIDSCSALGMKGLITNCEPGNTLKQNLNKSMGFIQIDNQSELERLIRSNPKWKGKEFYKMVFE